MCELTIYTATYNRAYILDRVYRSLLNQTCKEFIWMIVDDGSTDNTKELVKTWENEKKIKIEYYYKDNGGVHTARDFAFHHCRTKLIASCDSDDWVTNDAVESWLHAWNKKGGTQYAGIISVAEDANGTRVTDAFPPVEYATYQQYTYKYGCMKEKDTVLNMDIVKKLKDFPVYGDEKLVGEGYKWIQIPENNPFILLDKVTRVYEQQNDGYMKNISQNRFRNLKGFREMYRELILSGRYRKAIVRGYIGYIAYSIMLNDKNYIKDLPNKLVTLLMIPAGFFYYLKIKLKNVTAINETYK